MFSKRLVLFTISLVMFMESVDTTIINTSIPMIAASLKTDPLDLKLALISYLVSLAIFIPISGWFADKFGEKKVLLGSVAIFTLSSVACGFSSSLNQLIFFRMLQGMGSAFSLPVGRLIILRTFPRNELVEKMSYAVMIASMGNLMGPLIGGVISTNYSWRWIFWVNAPVGLLTLIISQLFIPNIASRHPKRLDKLGFVLFGGGLACFMFGLSSFSQSFFPISYSLGFLVSAVLLLMTYSYHSKHSNNPVIDLNLFDIRTFKMAIHNNIFYRIALGGIPFILPLMMQIGLGFTAIKSGSAMAPIAIGVVLMKVLDPIILRRFGYKKILTINSFIVALSIWSFMTIRLNDSAFYIGCLTFCYGFFISLNYACLNSLTFSNIKDEQLSSATSIMSTIQQLALSLGVALAAVLIRVLSLGYHANPSHIPLKVYHAAFFILGSIAISMILSLSKLSPEDGVEMIKRTP